MSYNNSLTLSMPASTVTLLRFIRDEYDCVSYDDVIISLIEFALKHEEINPLPETLLPLRKVLKGGDLP